MSDEVARYSFHINSAYRNSGTSTDMNIQLTQLITLQAKNTMFQVVVHSVTIPFSFYQLSSDIATIAIRVVILNNTYNGTIYLTPGNYSVNSINTEIQNKIKAYILTVTNAQYAPTAITATYNTITSKTTFSLVSLLASTITIYFSSNLSMGLFFGFTGNAVFSTTGSSTGDKIAVANPVNTIFLRSPSLRQLNNKEWQTEKGAFSDILFRCPIQTQQGTYLHMYQESEPVWIVNNVISNVNFYITTNLSYTPINLQGLDFLFHFTIIERDLHVWESIVNNTLRNQPAPPTVDNTEEMKALTDERNAIMKRIDTYKKKVPELSA